MTRGDELADLEASLSRRYRVVDTPVDIGGRTLSILHPASAEDLIDEVDFERDERLPYWAELWPSARVLGEFVLASEPHGTSLLELGCGAGLVAVCAALAGFDVVASDYYEDAVRFARVNARRNGTAVRGGMALDWRSVPADLRRFDTVVASDVLYEQPYGALVAHAIDAALSPDGVAYVADPGRVARDQFVEAIERLPLRIANRTEFPFVDGPVRQTITIFELRRPRDP